jgi:hypothetical protein
MTDGFGGFFDDALKGGGGGAPGFKFDRHGDVVRGTVTDIFKTKVTVMNSPTNEPKKDKNGNEIPQLNVTLQTDLRNWAGVIKIPENPETHVPLDPSEDDGKRRVFLKYDASRAVGKAIAESGAANDDFKVGAELALKYIDDQPMPVGKMKLFEARFKKGEPTSDGFDFGGGGQQAAPNTPAANSPQGDPWSSSTTPSGADEEPPF